MNDRAWLLQVSALVGASLVVLAFGILVTLPHPVVGIPEPSVVVRTGIPLLRWIANVCAIGAVGSVLVLVLLGEAGRDRAPALARRTSTAAVWTAAVWTVAALLGLWFNAAEISLRQLRLPVGGVLGYGGNVSLGLALLISAGSAGALTAYSVARLRRPSLPPDVGFLIALSGLTAVSMSGHPSQGEPPLLLMTASALHVTGAALWVGGLAITSLIIGADRQALAVVLPRFSRVAEASFALVGVSGLLLAATRLTGDVTPPLGDVVDALTQTGAGWLVMGKLACMVLLGCSGAYIRSAVVDRVARQQPTPLTAWAGLELAVMAVAVSLATALGRPL
ncbi:copper resistance D family protein [Nocardioides luteus]|uniref:copper resistance D family protein n=1 Tax=Nocardioides luteus TaxID=1844 RepID=UPI0018C90471|nr:CopD family protein [Nocardioides luteus]MBG6098665.1 putative copper resistance protein D [Nocardioides luteus]